MAKKERPNMASVLEKQEEEEKVSSFADLLQKENVTVEAVEDEKENIQKDNTSDVNNSDAKKEETVDELEKDNVEEVAFIKEKKTYVIANYIDHALKQKSVDTGMGKSEIVEKALSKYLGKELLNNAIEHCRKNPKNVGIKKRKRKK